MKDMGLERSLGLPGKIRPGTTPQKMGMVETDSPQMAIAHLNRPSLLREIQVKTMMASRLRRRI